MRRNEMVNNTSLKEQICQLEQSHLKAGVRTNPEELAKILADGFFEIGSSGKFIYKADCIVEGGIAPVDITFSNFEIHPLAEDVVLTTYRLENKTTKSRTLRSSIWKFIDGRWQMYFHQGTIEL